MGNERTSEITVCIGPVSSIFDILTYLVMWFVFSANSLATQHLFQTGWFMVGLVSQTLVVHMVGRGKYHSFKVVRQCL